jgi:hypothetical protein
LGVGGGVKGWGLIVKGRTWDDGDGEEKQCNGDDDHTNDSKVKRRKLDVEPCVPLVGGVGCRGEGWRGGDFGGWSLGFGLIFSPKRV